MNNLEKLVQQDKYWPEHTTIDVLEAMKGKVAKSVHVIDDREEMRFNFGDVSVIFYHSQDCCEDVSIDDVCGDLEDLIGVEIIQAEERTSGESDGEKPKADPEFPEYIDESFTWSFYTFRTIKGTVDVKWYGSSNGYYSESVDARVVKND